MGLLKLRKFSSVPNFEARVKQKTRQFEDSNTRIPKTFIEFIQENGKRIVKNTFIGGATVSLYTVPDDNLFYLISFGLGYANLLNSANHQASITVDSDVGTETIGIVRSAKLDAFGIVLNLVPALKFAAGDEFKLISSIANFIAVGNIIGFEIDKKFIEQRF